MSGDTSRRRIDARASVRRIQYVLIALQSASIAGIALMVTTLSVDIFGGSPAASYVEATILTPVVEPGGRVEARIKYQKLKDCLGTAIVTYFDVRADSSRVVSTLPLGDRPPGTFTVIRSYPVPLTATAGAAQFVETLAYQCADGPSVVRSPPMPFTVGAPK